MKKINLFFVAFAVLGLVGGSAAAQETTNLSASDVHFLPTVSVFDVKVQQENSNLTGTFAVQNDSKDLLGDLQYQIFLMDPLPEIQDNTLITDDAKVYDRVIVPEKLSLSPGERKSVSFSYTPPLVPKGEYRLRVRIITSKAQGLGWEDVSVSLGSATSFLSINGGGITIGDKAYTPTEGVNVDPESKIYLTYEVENKTNKDIEAVPVVETYDFDMTGEKISTIGIDQKTFKIGKTVNEVEISAPKKASSYYAVLSLRNEKGEKISNNNNYRFVVKGESGRVVFASFYELTNDMARVQVDVVGPADRESSVDATVKVSLFDGEKEIGTKQSEKMTLDKEGSVTGYLDFPLNQAIADPIARISLLSSSDGIVLDSYELRAQGKTDKKVAINTSGEKVIQNTPISSQNNNALIAAIVSVVVVLLALISTLVFIIKREKAGRGYNILNTLLLIFSISIAGIYLSSKISSATNGIPDNPTTMGQGQVYLYDRAVWAYINKPIHNGAEPNKNSIIFNMDVYMVHCLNAWEKDYFYIDVAKNGGKHSDNAFLTTDANWQSLVGKTSAGHSAMWTDTCGGQNAGTDSSGHVYYLCSPINGITGRLNISTTQQDTTLRIRAQKISESAGGDVRGNFGAYLFLNFVPVPTVDLKVNNSDGPLAVAPTGTSTPVNISWTSTNTSGDTPCTASVSPAAGWSGTKSANSAAAEAVNLAPSTAYNFLMTCNGQNGTVATDNVQVTVNELPPGPIIEVPDIVPFGNVIVGETSAPQEVTIRNIGSSSDLNITSITVSPSSEFSTTPASATIIPAGGTATFSVFFTPADNGYRSGTLTIESNDPASSVVIKSLSGTGVREMVMNFTVNGSSDNSTATPGKSFLIGWDVSNATSCSAQGDFANVTSGIGTSGNATDSVTLASKTYTLSCVSLATGVPNSKSITVSPAQTNIPPGKYKEL